MRLKIFNFNFFWRILLSLKRWQAPNVKSKVIWAFIWGPLTAELTPGPAGQTAQQSAVVELRIGQGEKYVTISGLGILVLFHPKVFLETVDILNFRQGAADFDVECGVELFDQTDCNTTPCPEGLNSGKCHSED